MSQYFDKIPTINSSRRLLTYKVLDEDIKLYSDNGVFSKGNIDEGSNIFIKTLLKLNLDGKILDLGCGYGVVGLTLKKFNDEINLTMSDVNLRALELSKENLKLNNIFDVNVIESDGLVNINENKFNYILFNPPIRIGKSRIFEIYQECYNHLDINGKLILVIRKDKGMESHLKFLKTIYNDSKIIYKEKGYFILLASKTI